MEVWALEAYGAAYTLQEMLTVKSDDVNGRTKMYKNIVDGNHQMEAGMLGILQRARQGNPFARASTLSWSRKECHTHARLASSSFRRTPRSESREFPTAIRIALTSPDMIKSWSYGEVQEAQTINYRTFKPERDGLFCAKIFGPVEGLRVPVRQVQAPQAPR